MTTKEQFGSVYICVCPTCLRAFISTMPFTSVPSHTTANKTCPAGQAINQSFGIKALMDTILFGVSSPNQKHKLAYLHPEDKEIK